MVTKIEPTHIYMLFAEPTRFDVDSFGNPRIPNGVPGPRSVYHNEGEARRVAAELAVKLKRRVHVLKSIASCTPPVPEPPAVIWSNGSVFVERFTLEADDEPDDVEDEDDTPRLL